MRIGISTSVIQRGRTGIGQYLFALLRAFQSGATPHRFVLFVLEEDLPLFEFARETMRLVPVPERFRPPVKDILWHQTVLPGLARQYELDVLHIPSYRRLLWRRPCALVATIHDLAPFHVARKYDWKRMAYGRLIARRLARRQHEVIAVSENTSGDVVRFFGLARNRITVVPNGLEHERFFPGSREISRAAVAQRHDLSRPFFLYIARLEHPGKNHVPLIDAFNRFKSATGSNWQLVFGGSDWHGAPAIHAAIARSPFRADIRALGFVPDNELPELYRAAGAFVYPSLHEGFGMPPVEAMACGCPVICSTSGSLGEVVGHAAAIVDPRNPAAIAVKLGAVAGEPAFREQLRRSGLERARRFDWRTTAAQTLNVYERAAARTKTQPQSVAIPLTTADERG